jgi:signal peptidase I
MEGAAMSNRQDDRNDGEKRGLIGQLRPFLFFIGAIFAFQGLAAKTYYVPTGSMVPAMVNGDRIVVSKYPYGWSWASVPYHLLPPVEGRLLASLPERGDIVTVVRPGTRTDLIKRVIGLPGDEIAVRHGVVFLNGKALPRVRKADMMIPIDGNLRCDEPVLAGRRVIGPDGNFYCRLPIYRETLPNGASYDTVDLGDGDLGNGYFSSGDNYAPVRVPEGHVFLMGDHRDNSLDSRFSLAENGLGGPVPIENLGGRAELVTHSFDGSTQLLNPISWFTSLRGGRAGTSLRES